MAQIPILLATHKGEKNFHEQFKSLLAQTNQDWELLIRDDGSTDRTPEIIQVFADAHPNKVRIINDDGGTNEHLGAKHNFGRLLELSDASYVMFCDQDDVWRS